MGRRNARKNAFFLLFQMDFNEAEEFEQVKEIFFQEREEALAPAAEEAELSEEEKLFVMGPLEEEDKAFILGEVEGVKAHQEEIDDVIRNSAKGWTPERMNKVDLAILRLAIYEMRYGEDTPVGVAINEAVELAKKFSSDEAPAFINGVLGKAAEQM